MKGGVSVRVARIMRGQKFNRVHVRVADERRRSRYRFLSSHSFVVRVPHMSEGGLWRGQIRHTRSVVDGTTRRCGPALKVFGCYSVRLPWIIRVAPTGSASEACDLACTGVHLLKKAGAEPRRHAPPPESRSVPRSRRP